jgi:nucleotide-binding universal stress UspA family protein
VVDGVDDSVVAALLAGQVDGTRNLDVSYLRRNGEAADQLERVAAAVMATAIIVGARGRPPWRAPLLGSVARAVVERSRRPVIIVPQ